MLEPDPRRQPVPPSPAMIILPDYYLVKKNTYDDQGLPLHFTGNQDAYLTQAVRNLQIAKSKKRQLRYWVICLTKQSFAISETPHHTPLPPKPALVCPDTAGTTHGESAARTRASFLRGLSYSVSGVVPC